MDNDEDVKEYIVNGITVKIHGGQPDRKKVEDAMQIYAKSLIQQGIKI